MEGVGGWKLHMVLTEVLGLGLGVGEGGEGGDISCIQSDNFMLDLFFYTYTF